MLTVEDFNGYFGGYYGQFPGFDGYYSGYSGGYSEGYYTGFPGGYTSQGPFGYSYGGFMSSSLPNCFSQMWPMNPYMEDYI